jgi:choline dehydrogenase-like flavoprotein
MLLDAEQQDGGMFGDVLFDVCITGAGPAGITLARALASKGRRVALMEAGALEMSPQSQALYQGANIGLPYYPLDACRLRYLGGTSNHWGGYTRPLDARDFEPLAHQPLNEWPIKKRDLDPYAAATAEILDLPPEEAPIDIFGGREDAIAPSAYRVTQMQFASKFKDELSQSKAIALCLNANLVDISLDPDLRAVAGLVFRAYTRGEPFQVRARQFVLCCGGLENARALLNANPQIAGGIGNEHDLVGRFFCEHLEIPVGRAVLASPPADLDFYIASDKLITERRCLSFELELVPLERDESSCTLPFYERLARALHEPASACFDAIVMAVVGQSVNRDSRVALSEERDSFGLRRLALDWHLADIDGATIKIAAEEIGRAMARHNVGRLQLDPWVSEAEGAVPLSTDVGGSSHHMCTTRMSGDPAAGVVDRNCRVHGIENLYIGGSSVFASPGVSNPTFTIVQLALRLADHLDASLKG